MCVCSDNFMLCFYMHVTCEVQRGRVASLRVPAVDVVRATQLLHSGQAALLGCVQQRSVSSQEVLDVSVPVLHQVQRRIPISVLLGGVRSVLRRGEEIGAKKYGEKENGKILIQYVKDIFIHCVSDPDYISKFFVMTKPKFKHAECWYKTLAIINFNLTNIGPQKPVLFDPQWKRFT